MPTLHSAQVIFAKRLPRLLDKVFDFGLEVTLGETYRSPQEAARLAATGAGITRSLHCERLAIDLQLFKDNRYLTQTEEYRQLGEFWESLSGDGYECAWGGRFTRQDGGHFSIAWDGRR